MCKSDCRRNFPCPCGIDLGFMGLGHPFIVIVSSLAYYDYDDNLSNRLYNAVPWLVGLVASPDRLIPPVSLL